MAPRALTRNVSESTNSSGCASGAPYRDAIGPDRVAPRIVKTTPAMIVVQNAVSRSTRLSSLRWISAAPSARSENTTRGWRTRVREPRDHIRTASAAARWRSDERANELAPGLRGAHPDQAAENTTAQIRHPGDSPVDIAADARREVAGRACTTGQVLPRRALLCRPCAASQAPSGWTANPFRPPRAHPPLDDGDDRYTRAGRRRLRRPVTALARRPAPLDHRRRGRPPAGLERGQPRSGRPERRVLQPRRLRLRARRHALRSRCDTEVLPICTRSTARSLPGARGMFTSPSGTTTPPGVLPATALASSRSTTRSSATCVVFGSELECVLASGLVGAELDPEAISTYLVLGFVPGADDAACAMCEAAAGGAADHRGQPGAR